MNGTLLMTNFFTKIDDFINTNDAVKLRSEFVHIFEQLAKQGKLSATLFSGAITHTEQGQFADMHNRGNTLMHFHPNIDTRLFTAKWRFVYATEQNKIICLNFFSRYGDLVYQVCSTNKAQYTKFSALIVEMADTDNSHSLPSVAENFSKVKYTKPIDRKTLIEKWSMMTNVHQASKIFKYHGNDPVTVYQTLGKNYARKITTEKLTAFFNALVKNQLKLMMFARNYAAVQCHVGSLVEIELTEQSLKISIMDFDFILHLLQLGDIWLVAKPTDSGLVNSINVFDKNENEILILTDKRTRDETENTGWLDAIQAI